MNNSAQLQNQFQIICAMGAMMLLSIIVAVAMLRERIIEMRTRRIHPSKVASSTKMNAVLENTRAADNYKNLFEMPVLFYALCAALLITNSMTTPMIIAVWVYVAMRYIHSFIHIGYNHVMHRFYVFAASMMLLGGMWAALVWSLVSK